jgi:peptidoglycan/LPS O-acetylase OafA/YrhL
MEGFKGMSRRYFNGAQRISNDSRVPELDGLRGVAISLVVFFHYFQATLEVRPATAASYLQAGTRLAWTGVDLFFVLSGFLIGGILLDSRTSTNYYSTFYKRRFFRIVPLYLVCVCLAPLLVYLGLGPMGRQPSALLQDGAPWYAYLTFTQNFWMTHAATLGVDGLGMTWSLAVEEQFYLTLPLYIRSIGERWLVRALAIGVLSAPVLRNVLLQMRSDDWVGIYTMMLCRADALLLGVLAAVLLRNEKWRARIQRAGVSFAIAIPILLAGLAFLTLRAGSMQSLLMKRFGFTWVAFFYATILLFILTRPDNILTRLLRMKWLCRLGTLAYGIYLFHQPVQYLLFGMMRGGGVRITDFRSFALTLAAIPLTLLVATLSWRYFEKPMLQVGRRSTFDFGARRPLEAPASGAD